MKTRKEFIQEAHRNDNWGYTPEFGNTPEHQLRTFGRKGTGNGPYTHPEHPGHEIHLAKDESGKFSHINTNKNVTRRPLSHDLTAHVRQFHLKHSSLD